MTGQLQVRQGMFEGHVRLNEQPRVVAGDVTWGQWHDVTSPGWLVGFVLPHSPFVYEFRYAPEEG